MSINATTGNWTASQLETPVTATGTNNWGMVYQAGSHLNSKIEKIANELQTVLADANQSLDNPILLAKISALNGHYNGARQAQSGVMKAMKDTSQAIIRNI
ncbi:EscF/YscF/HrpA family type III secretion system needle major subunit [Enterobacter mori]|uniref:EscF/YscF/HrpA family type III secretion system needle major subunit n=1 Tax=Enterobacter mori TaxID=539813 RepID=UPI001B8D258A|nr:EscF/YscF/HrpA family type III secretion system needle major subunit [Enterobacter mori]MBS3050418.1 type III secretion apparatus needle protein [Enterobacter mori]